jgi:hypothetical protein
VFYGHDGEECEKFVTAVRRIARREGKQHDGTWIADALEGCFEGEALRWHVELDDDVKRDWKQLEKALLRKYPSSAAQGTSNISNSRSEQDIWLPYSLMRFSKFDPSDHSSYPRPDPIYGSPQIPYTGQQHLGLCV